MAVTVNAVASVNNEERAREALRLVQIEPARAAELATLSSQLARQQGNCATAAVAERARGLAALHLADLDTAVRHLRTAVALARRAGSSELAAEARMTLAFALNRRGKPTHALAEIDAALGDLGTLARARARVQRAAIQQQLGRLDDALAGYRAALPVLRRAADGEWEQRVLLNRGLLHAFRHNYAAATKDLCAAERLCASLDLRLPAAFVQENLGFVASRLGDIPTALHHFDAAARRYRALNAPIGSLLVERSELLLSVRLVAEAREAAQQAVAEFERTKRGLTTPEARLLLARTAVLDAEPGLALREARQAVREFQRQNRPEWVALARLAVVTARIEADPGSRGTSRELASVATALDAAGWSAAALDARLLAGRRGLDGPSPAVRAAARGQLSQVRSARRSGPAASRARAWYAEALLRRDAGNLPGSSAAAAAGLRTLDEHRATMLATDLRARVSGLRIELAELGLRNAVQTGRPARVLHWAELGRGRHLLERPARPPTDPLLTRHLAELRATVSDLEQRAGRGRPTAALLHRQAVLERAIRDHCRRQRGGLLAATESSTPGTTALTTELGGAALVEFTELDDALYAVTVAAGRARLHRLGPLGAIRELVQWLPFAIRRLARQPAKPASSAAALALLRDTAHRLDAALLQPLSAEIGKRPLVLVPTGVLQSMPWALLPSCADRAVTVAPSATLWAAARRRVPLPGPTVVVAGPGLPGAQAEATEVAALHGVAPLLGADAAVASVTAQLDGAGLAHIAAHGSVRADNPLFSALRLADGPLTVYDLERLRRGPDTVVLAACESGRNVVLAGDELLGLSAALLSRDTRQLIASVVPVPDAATAPLMVSLHAHLVAGDAPAVALLRAQQAIGAEEPAALAAAAGFVCLGAGLAALPPAPRDVPQPPPCIQLAAGLL